MKIKFSECVKYMVKGPFGSDMKKSLYVPKGEDTYKVYVQGNAIQKDENLGDYYIQSEYFHQKLKRFEVHPGDYIITCDGTLGKYIKLSENIERGVISSSLLLLKLDEEVIYDKYFELLWDNSMLSYLASQARNACLVHLPSAKTIGEIIINLPELSVQREMADKAFLIVNIIQQRNKELSMLDDLIKARFVELFGNPIKNEKHWETFKLGECLKRIDNGKSFTCDVQARTGECPAILKLSAVTYGDYRPEENKALLDEKQFVESTEVHSGDLLFTRKNTPELVGMAAYVYNTPNHLMMPDLIFRLVPNERMTAIFLWQLINNREFRPVIQSIAGGSAKSMSNISKERLNNISVICPPINEQIRLNEMINQVNKSKVAILKNYSQGGVLSYDNQF